MPRFFSLTTGRDTLTGLAGDDNIFQLEPATIQSVDIVTGGATGSFLDIVVVTAAGSIAASQFTGVTGIDEIVFTQSGTSIALPNGFANGSSLGYLAIAGSNGDDTVDVQAERAAPIAFFANAGNDAFEGGGGNDAVSIAAAELTSNDRFNARGGIDNLYLTGGGTVGAAAFTNVSGFEGLVLANGAYNVTLANGVVSQSSLGYFAVAAGADADVDASAVTNGVAIAFYGTDDGSVSFAGGNGNDAFLFAGGQLTGADAITGGGGNDTIWMTASGVTNATDLVNVTGIEGVFQQNGGAFYFADGITQAASLAAVGSASVDTFDASEVTGYGLVFAGNGGADTLIGGADDDVFMLADGDFAMLDGNEGVDRIVVTNANPELDLSTTASRIADMEIVSFEGVDHGSLTMSGSDIAQVSGSNELYIIGEHLDAFDSGTGYTQVASGVSNDAVAPGVTFYEFRHSSGSTLFVDTRLYGATSTDGPVDTLPENTPTSHVVYSDSATYQPGTTVTYSLFGPDAALFDIDTATGDVTFKTSPDYELPQDQGQNNRYDFSVAIQTDRAIPGTFQVSGAVVTDVDETSFPVPAMTSGYDWIGV